MFSKQNITLVKEDLVLFSVSVDITFTSSYCSKLNTNRKDTNIVWQMVHKHPLKRNRQGRKYTSYILQTYDSMFVDY